MPAYSEKLTADATTRNEALFSLEINGRTCDPNEVGKAVIEGSVTQDNAIRLNLFARLLRAGKAPHEAFAEAWPDSSRGKTLKTMIDESANRREGKSLSVTDIFPDRVQ